MGIYPVTTQGSRHLLQNLHMNPHTIEPDMASSERITVTLPKDLVAEMDRFEANRSRFVLHAILREVLERHRKELSNSLESVHPETLELAEADFESWAASTTPEDSDLVDPNEGEPVSWVEGQGWTRPPT